MVDNSYFDIQNRLQTGCSCCGWEGDPFLIVRIIPRKYGDGACVIHKQPGEKAILMWRSEPPVHQVDHRTIDYFRDARKNWENMQLTLQMLEKHDRQVELDVKQKEVEMNVQLSSLVGRHLRKEGKL